MTITERNVLLLIKTKISDAKWRNIMFTASVLVSGMKDDQKVDKKRTYMKTETCTLFF